VIYIKYLMIIKWSTQSI